MMNFLRKYQYQIFLFTTGFFLLGTFVGFGGYFFTPKGSPNDTVVEVDGDKIPLRLFNNRYNRALDNVPKGQTLDAATRNSKRDEAVRDLVQGVVFTREAKRYGIEVPDQQVITSLAQIQAFQDKGVFSPQLYARALQYQLKTTPQDFEEEQRQSIAFFKLRWLIQSCIKVTDKELEMAQALDPKKPVARDQLLQEKVIWSFNQWFSQMGQKIRVKTHFDVLEGQN